jgi:hypothetical protein
MKTFQRYFLLIFLSMLAACGTLEIRIDRSTAPGVETTRDPSENQLMQSIAVTTLPVSQRKNKT